MSTAFLHRRPENKARAACRNAAGVPGAARKPPTHYDVGAAMGFLSWGRAPWQNVPPGARQPRMVHAIRSVRQRPAENLEPGDGFPSHSTHRHQTESPDPAFPSPSPREGPGAAPWRSRALSAGTAA